jgi:hypothetical protein
MIQQKQDSSAESSKGFLESLSRTAENGQNQKNDSEKWTLLFWKLK